VHLAFLALPVRIINSGRCPGVREFLLEAGFSREGGVFRLCLRGPSFAESLRLSDEEVIFLCDPHRQVSVTRVKLASASQGLEGDISLRVLPMCDLSLLPLDAPQDLVLAFKIRLQVFDEIIRLRVVH